MKARHLLVTLPLLALACGGTPPPPPKPPTPVVQTAPPPPPPSTGPVVEGAVTQQTINGINVIVKRIPGAELAAMQLYIKGGARNWTAANAGVEKLSLSVATHGGTTQLDKDSFSRKLTAMGSDLGSTSTAEYAAILGKALTPKFDETFELFASSFMTPALPANEIELQRQQMLSGLRHEEEDPDSRLRIMTHKALFKGHPYEPRASGTIDSVTKLGADQLKMHLTTLRQGNRLVLVVVGDVDANHVADLVKAKLAVPAGGWTETAVPPVSFAKSNVDTVTAQLPTNYIQGIFTTPHWKDPDFYTAMVAMEQLQFRVFEEVRTKRNLSYAPNAGLRWGTFVPIGYLYVTAVDPDTTIKVMFEEVKKLKSTPLTTKELDGAKATYLTNNLVSEESTDDQASWLAWGQIFTGDWRFESQLIARVKQVTPEQIQAFATKHIQHLQFNVLGKSQIDKATFGSL